MAQKTLALHAGRRAQADELRDLLELLADVRTGKHRRPGRVAQSVEHPVQLGPVRAGVLGRLHQRESAVARNDHLERLDFRRRTRRPRTHAVAGEVQAPGGGSSIARGWPNKKATGPQRRSPAETSTPHSSRAAYPPRAPPNPNRRSRRDRRPASPRAGPGAKRESAAGRPSPRDPAPAAAASRTAPCSRRKRVYPGPRADAAPPGPPLRA